MVNSLVLTASVSHGLRGDAVSWSVTVPWAISPGLGRYVGEIVFSLIMVPVPFNKTQLNAEKFSAVASVIVIPSSQIFNGLPASAVALRIMNKLSVSDPVTEQELSD